MFQHNRTNRYLSGGQSCGTPRGMSLALRPAVSGWRFVSDELIFVFLSPFFFVSRQMTLQEIPGTGFTSSLLSSLALSSCSTWCWASYQGKTGMTCLCLVMKREDVLF